MSRAVTALVLLAALFGAVADATVPEPGAAAFAPGRALFEDRQFEQAMVIFEQAVALEPTNSTYHYWLAQSYGRSAERAYWFRALRLARKTLRELKIAVELDPDNRSAWSDLTMYYRLAPGFLGGSMKKAREIEARLVMSTLALQP